ncbi:MAG: response regulator [Armatimonadetes bacterium]|nr:response regulator [Armatimonadota bacterium]
MADKRILIVEDTIENLRLFRAILQLEDAIVLQAERALKGIEIARSELPDVILMDMQMPEMDGLTAIRILRADPLTQHIPIIVITASAMNEDRQRAQQAGCNGYITKPVDPASFGSQIVAFMQVAPAASEL